jgi:hypothetical protein
MPTHYAVNPATGERLMLLGGKWVPATSAASGSPTGAPKLTEGQAKDGFNAKRMLGAGGTIAGLEGHGYDAGLADLSMGLPVGHVRNYNAAKDEWLDSLLRMTTGAAMTKDEIAHAENTYFPKLGDSPEVRKQKAAMRARVQQDSIQRAGPGAAQIQAAAAPTALAKPQPAAKAKRLRFNPQTGNIE